MKYALVIGHNEYNQGAYGSYGLSEFIFNKELVKDILSESRVKNSINDYKVFYFDKSIPKYGDRMKEIHNRIDKWGADYSISFHFNSFSDELVTGHEILYYSEGGKTLAKRLDKLFDRYMDNNDRNIKKRSKNQRGGGFLSRGMSKCIIVEPFFSSHQHLYVRGGKKRDGLIMSYVDFLV